MTGSNVKTLIWDRSSLKLIDQRKLPFEEYYVDCRNHIDVSNAIKDMVIRGAPAIGVAAAYGVALAAINFKGSSISDFIDYISGCIDSISASRPTAVNLFWALKRMRKLLDSVDLKSLHNQKTSILSKLQELLVLEAEKIEKEDIETNRQIGKNALNIFQNKKTAGNKGLNILTHCNAGALATAGYGTALGVIRSLYSAGLVKNVIVDETRPYLQGARLTAWELYREKIPYFIITDNMAGYFMNKGDVDIVVVGADRIAANGDTANKIGTFSLSVLAKYHDIEFYIAAPYSTVDFNTSGGEDIIIEQRPGHEVRQISGKMIIPDSMPVSNPSFDVTPSGNITAIITEKGVVYPPFKETLLNTFNSL